MRVGIGYDVHRLKSGRRLILGGVDIPHEKGLDGHSDADVLLHSISDAILGALSLGDIGQHFPNTDPKYKDANSRELLRKVVGMIKDEGWYVENVDAVLIAERPRLAGHIEKMCLNIADDLGVARNCVSVKATTNERIGFLGREEGIAAEAVVLLKKLEGSPKYRNNGRIC